MITKQPSDVMIKALEHAIFTCKAEGFEVKYKWKRYNSENIIGNQSTLNISQATPLDSDQYYCVAMTEGGSVRSINVTLTVDGENNNVSCVPCIIMYYISGIIAESYVWRFV